MKTSQTLLKGALAAIIMLSGLYACNKNSSNPTPRTKSYNIQTYPGFDVSGTVTFTEVLNTDSVKVDVKLTGKDVTGVALFPIYIRQGTSLENGPVKFNLGNLDGNIKELQNEVNISFSDLIAYNGSLDVYRNTTDTNKVIAQGEIGANEVFRSYTMTNPNVTGDVSNGQLRIYKRATGAYIVVNVDTSSFIGTEAHPARVYQADGITKEFDLTDLSADNGVSATEVSDHTYDDLTKTKRVVKVFESVASLDVTISQGTIQ